MKTLILIALLAIFLVSCSQASNDASIAALPPWGRLLIGLIIIAITVMALGAYGRGELEISNGPFDGRPATAEDFLPISCFTLITFIFGVLLIVSAIGGTAGGTITTWLDSYSNFYATLENVLEIIWFLIVEIIILGVVVFTGFSALIEKENRREALIPFLFLGTPTAAYWVWVFWTNRFEELFIKPFTSLYHIFFK